MALAKLANSTVNQSQTLTRPDERALWPLPVTSPAMKATVVITLPTSTTNITGLRATSRGSSLPNELRIAGPMRSAHGGLLRRSPGCACGVPSRLSGIWSLSVRAVMVVLREELAGVHRKCSTMGPSARAGK